MQGKDLSPIHPSPTLLRISKGTMLRGWRNGQATIAQVSSPYILNRKRRKAMNSSIFNPLL